MHRDRPVGWRERDEKDGWTETGKDIDGWTEARLEENEGIEKKRIARNGGK